MYLTDSGAVWCAEHDYNVILTWIDIFVKLFEFKIQICWYGKNSKNHNFLFNDLYNLTLLHNMYNIYRSTTL